MQRPARRANEVGLSAIREVLGAKGVYDCDGAIVVTNSTFTWRAKELNANGSGDRPLTGPNSADGALAWSPDGRRIGFLRGSRASYGDGSPIEPQLWVMSADGCGQKQLTDSTVDPEPPGWSPTEPTLAFSRGEISTVRADGNAEIRLTSRSQ